MSMFKDTYDVIVVGAGVSGLATAAIGAAKNVSPNNKIKKSEKDNDTDNCSGK